MVDAGGNFIYLNSLLLGSGLSQNGQYLYNFDAVNLSLQLIDLEKLKLEKILPLEVEGPNGIGTQRIYNIYETMDGDLMLSDNYNVTLIDKAGNKSLEFQYGNHDFAGEKLSDEMQTTYDEILSKDGNTLISLYGDQQMDQSPQGIAIFDLKDKLFRYQPIPIFAELDAYRLKYYIDGRAAGIEYADIYLLLKNDSLIYSNSVSNQVNFYALSTDSLISKNFESKLTDQLASANYPNRADSQKEYEEIDKRKNKEVHFGSLIFDNKNDVYWRFTKEMDRMKGDTIIYKTVLTAFDIGFNQLHEELLPSNFLIPSKYFAREGMI
jgi:hypothetical protein